MQVCARRKWIEMNYTKVKRIALAAAYVLICKYIVQGEYTLKDVYINELRDEKMLLSEVISLEKQNLLAQARAKGCMITVNVRMKSDYEMIISPASWTGW